MSERGDHSTFRVLVFGADGAEILLTRSHAGVQLPEVTIPRWERLAENVTAEMKRSWGEVVVCLFELESSSDAGKSRYVAARHLRTCDAAFSLLQWMTVTDLSDGVFTDPDDCRALRECATKCRPSISTAESGPFVRLNWFEELCGWISQSTAARRLYLTGDFRQLNASPTFSLIRFETNGPALWFKAVGQPNEREFPITLEFVKTFPSYAPEFVAARPDWKGWLTFEAEGTNLAETADLSLWTNAAAALAKLQIASIDRCKPLLESGAHDLSPVTLNRTVSPFLAVIARLMREQTKIPPPVMSAEGLALLGERIREAVSTLKQLEIPDTLGHLDLNPGNIILSAQDRCVFLDWAEAYVGHPFYSFEYLLEHFRRLAGHDLVAEKTLTAAYLGPWMEMASRNLLMEAMALAPLVAAFAYGAGPDAWRRPERFRDPKIAGYLRSLVRRMDREANQLCERSTSCLS